MVQSLVSRFVLFLFLLVMGASFTACNTDATPASTVRLLEAKEQQDAKTYQDVSLQNYHFSQNKMMFGPQNIRLGGQTPYLKGRNTARTNKGLHLHLSIDNQHYINNNNIFDRPLEDGSYDLFAFIADSYYESIKQPNAIMGRHIEVKGGNLVKSTPIEQIALVYNVPIGTHTISETDSILFDFVLYATELSEQGNYVTVKINEQEPWRIDQWQPYYLTGLTEGTHQVRLTLNNASGKNITPPVEQLFTVKKPENPVK